MILQKAFIIGNIRDTKEKVVIFKKILINKFNK